MTLRRKMLETANGLLATIGLRLDRTSRHRIRSQQRLNQGVDLGAIRRRLEEPLRMLVLGSLDEDFQDNDTLTDLLEIYSLDAVAPGAASRQACKVFPIKSVVSGASESVEFIERNIAGVSSILQPDPGLVAKYGLEDMYQERARHQVDASSLSDLSAELGVEHWDYIKTDLEGMDLKVVKGLGDAIEHVSLVQMELRFEPFYIGEPYFHEAVAFMHERGFSVIDLRPEWWRIRTQHWTRATQGRAVFCNVVFANNAVFNADSRNALRHALILGACGFVNLAEGLIDNLEPEVRNELQNLLLNDTAKEYLPFRNLPHVTVGTSD